MGKLRHKEASLESYDLLRARFAETAGKGKFMIDEERNRWIMIDRAIATVGGSTFCDFPELRAMVQLAYEEKIEAVMTVGHRKAWDPGSKEASTHEGTMQGCGLRSYASTLMRMEDSWFWEGNTYWGCK
jgi:hypothetical protein